MNLRTFLLVDSVALDLAGVAALVAGRTVLGVALLAAATATFVAFLGRHRRASAA